MLEIPLDHHHLLIITASEGGGGGGEERGEGERREKGGENIYIVTEPLKELQIQTEMAGTCKILYIIICIYFQNIINYVHIKYTLNEDKINIPIHVQYV